MRRKVLSVIFVYFNTPKEIQDSIHSLESTTKIPLEIIVVDNASILPLPRTIRKIKKIKLIVNKANIGYGRAINQAARIAKGDILLIVNPDTLFHKNTVQSMSAILRKKSKVAMVGPRIVGSNGSLQDSISEIPFLPKALIIFSFLRKIWPFKSIESKYHLRHVDRKKEQTVPAISGACIMIRKNIFELVGGFDERFFMYFEEADLSYRVKKLGYTIVYTPKATITHFVGKSSSDKNWIRKTFQKSRFLFFKKYHGTIAAILGEVALRLTQPNILFLAVILLISFILNLYRISELMMFLGDYGRDYLAAKDMLLTGKIPLVGITSSVVWLHQGPLSVYLIGLSFLVSQYNPVSPAILYAFFGVLTVLGVYKFGSVVMNNKVGLLSASFYATSPLFVVNARIPYHTTLIPFVSVLVFYSLYEFLSGRKKFLFPLFFFSGILLQFELSNIVILILIFMLFLFFKIHLSIRQVLFALLSFLIGILPFFIYDLTHKFVQTGGLLLWTMHRIGLFLGITPLGNGTSSHLGSALSTTWMQIYSSIFPRSEFIAIAILFILFIPIALKFKDSSILKDKGLIIILSWLFVPLVGFLVHSAPGTAYFPVIYPALALFIGYGVYKISKDSIVVLVIFVLFCAYNFFYILQNHHFMAVSPLEIKGKFLGDWPLGIGVSLHAQKEIALFIVNDARGESFQVNGGGFLAMFPSYVDNYRFLVWYLHGNISNTAKTQYILYAEKDEVPSGKFIYTNGFIYVTKHEKS